MKIVKLKNQSGITLVALVVTIVVLLILAGITITMLFNENGIIKKAQEASNKTAQDKVITEEGLNSLTNQMNNALTNSEGTGGGSGISIQDIIAAPATYYGKTVEYTVGNSSLQNTLTTDGIGWKIFYADANYLYLIADDCVSREALPASTNASGEVTSNKPLVGDDTQGLRTARFATSTDTGVVGDYAGSARVTENLKYLNESYFETIGTSSITNANIKAVAYMLDTEAWKNYKDASGKAAFAIGGPSVEMLLSSYSQKYPDTAANYKAEAPLATPFYGYKISKDGTNFSTGYTDMFDTSDHLYMPPYNSTTKETASGYWLASPGAQGPEYVMSTVSATGTCHGYKYTFVLKGFRPLIALNSNIQLEPVGEGDNISYRIK